jgi:hypothetical protein
MALSTWAWACQPQASCKADAASSKLYRIPCSTDCARLGVPQRKAPTGMRRSPALPVSIFLALAFFFGLETAQAEYTEPVTCAEALIYLQKTVRGLDLNDDELDEIDDLILKAKLEYDDGRARSCKVIVGNILLVYVLKKPPVNE